jgi:hypothetical protein
MVNAESWQRNKVVQGSSLGPIPVDPRLGTGCLLRVPPCCKTVSASKDTKGRSFSYLYTPSTYTTLSCLIASRWIHSFLTTPSHLQWLWISCQIYAPTVGGTFSRLIPLVTHVALFTQRILRTRTSLPTLDFGSVELIGHRYAADLPSSEPILCRL